MTVAMATALPRFTLQIFSSPPLWTRGEIGLVFFVFFNRLQFSDAAECRVVAGVFDPSGVFADPQSQNKHTS